ncbi:hypothetical protein FNF27_06802 [Cafeteria roenbergensis]|uniref:Uncharacterized protein n=1 Tax=Cafeteria roenbergensis TaxID=33653 RepID=A0A5A8E1G6_CAFRO|nr:hypothetical protein FNF27_06802 [Cafeteria roenbergensis]
MSAGSVFTPTFQGLRQRGPLLQLALVVSGLLSLATADSTAPFLLKDINVFGGNGQVRHLFEINDAIFFGGDAGDGENKQPNVELFTYSIGLSASPVKRNIDTATTTEDLYMCDFDGTTYVTVFFYGQGVEVGLYDPGQWGVYSAADVFAGETSSFPAYLTVYSSKMYFAAEAATGQGRELHAMSSDKTVSKVHDFSTEAGKGGDPKYLTVFNGKLYMQADSHGLNKGVELLVYDGSTVKLGSDINTNGADSSNPSHMCVFDSQLYMSADKGDGIGQELYVYDGTNAPTLVSDVNPGTEGSFLVPGVLDCLQQQDVFCS